MKIERIMLVLLSGVLLVGWAWPCTPKVQEAMPAYILLELQESGEYKTVASGEMDKVRLYGCSYFGTLDNVYGPVDGIEDLYIGGDTSGADTKTESIIQAENFYPHLMVTQKDHALFRKLYSEN